MELLVGLALLFGVLWVIQQVVEWSKRANDRHEWEREEHERKMREGGG